MKKHISALLLALLLISPGALSKSQDFKSVALDMYRATYKKIFACFGSFPLCDSVEDCVKKSSLEELTESPAVQSGKITVADLKRCTKGWESVSCESLNQAPPKECAEIPVFKK